MIRRVTQIAALCLGLCAACTPRLLAQVDPLAKIDTRLGPGFRVALSVSVGGIDEAELCGPRTLDADGGVTLTVGGKPIEKVPLNGATCQQARERIAQALSRFYSVAPEVRVSITRIPRMQVWLSGAARAAGVVTLPRGARLSDLLAGTGYLPSADLTRVRISRTRDGARTVLLANFSRYLAGGATADDSSDPVLQPGDVVDVDETAVPAAAQEISVLGEVRSQGRRPYRTGMTVRDAIQASQGVTPLADTDRLTIARRDGSMLTVSWARAQQGIPTDNLPLEPDDTVVVARRDSGRRFTVVGAVAAPQTFEFRGAPTLSQAIADCGGFRPDADTRAVVVMHNMLVDPAHAQPVTVDFERIRKGGSPDVPLQSGDMVQVPQKRRAPNHLLDIGLTLLRLFLP